ncbi:amidohydrolase family protein [Nonlabens xiamenensis]|uniref:amidohydrolase family protein n=1 Tax=Nonlabens xiamenensis TaxID=2341043 RepID=UPI0013DE5235|nr:amidohydrolase family protein [Nonlabens xiamenensis]
MDMEYMGAGSIRIPYKEQLKELINLKENKKNQIHVFPGIDPRRLQEDKSFLTYLMDRFSSKKFSGVKLYPALGFYPFDKRFKSLYEYCIRYDIPIMTHCIEGTIYYRGSKTRNSDEHAHLNNKNEWNHHPILKVNAQSEPLKLPQRANHDFTKNFTHPLNYKCLLDPKKATEYFGDQVDFSQLKICLAHFGGSAEWDRYFEDIYETYNNNLFNKENIGKATAYTNVQKIWDSASWLSIIYDLMATYDNVYADMSFMLYNKNNFELLKLLIDDNRVGHKILFGTDFYVVAQKGTEKRLYHTIRAELGEERFKKVASINPENFLKTKF